MVWLFVFSFSFFKFCLTFFFPYPRLTAHGACGGKEGLPGNTTASVFSAVKHLKEF